MERTLNADLHTTDAVKIQKTDRENTSIAWAIRTGMQQRAGEAGFTKVTFVPNPADQLN